MKKMINIISNLLFSLSKICCLILIFLTTEQVLARYFFNASSVGIQELQWHLFGAVFLLASARAYKEDAHVRVDIVYEKLSTRSKKIVNIFGTLCLLIPTAGVIIYFGYDFAKDAYEIKEISPDPGGLHYRWVIKAIIPFAFLIILLQSIVTMFSKNKEQA